MTPPMNHHPPPETIAMIAEGNLPRRELAPHLEHIAGCAGCRTELQLARQALEEDEGALPARQPSSRVWWLAAAAAVVVVAMLALWPLLRSRDASIESLAALAPRSARIVEPRLTGGFAWAPYSGAMRGDDAKTEAQRLKLGGAAGEAIDAAERDSSADAQHAAGVAFVLIEKPGEAAERLRVLADKAPREAAVWSDLAAAQYAAALQLKRPSLLAQALVSADRAIAIDARHAEGLFNRALILERMGLTQQSRAAWQRYLEVDPSSEWAREARQRLNALPAASSDLLFRRELPAIERGANVDGIVRRFREQARAWGEAEFLGRWGEAAQRGDAKEAARLLAIAKSLGEALRKQSGEALLADAVSAIESTECHPERSEGPSPAPCTAEGPSPSARLRMTLADAHATYRRGRIAYSRRLPTAAEADLRRAAALFASAKSPMARMARYYAANARFDQNDLAGARVELESLLADEPSHYIALGALIRWQLSRCHTFDGDANEALPLLTASANAFRRLDERNNLGFVEALLADTYSAIGRPEESWAARIRSFEVLSRDGRSDRLLANLASVVTAEMRAGNREVALALLAIERDAGRQIDELMIRSNTLTRGAVLRAELGDAAGARELVEELSATVATIRDPEVRALAAANAQFARGAVLLRDDPAAASNQLGDALGAYRTMSLRAQEIDCHLLRARAAQALRRGDDAAREIEEGLAALERFRVRLEGGGIARGVFDAGDELLARAIGISLDRGDEAKAFQYAELARMRFSDSVDPSLAASIHSRLAGTGTALVELVVLPEESVVFFIDANGLAVARKRIAREDMFALARRSTSGDREAAAALFELFLRPFASRVADTLIVVPDPSLDAVPFAALYDAQARQHLIERVRVLRAESAASLRSAAPRPAPARVVSVSLPSGADSGSATLAETDAEVAEISGAYASAVQLSARSTFGEFVAAARGADVVHLSGHTRDDGNGGTAALDFAAQRVPWRAVASAPFGGVPVVVLAACDSLRLPQLSESRAPSLGGAFLAAGAAEVIGTLRPIGDRDARELFRAIHRDLASGVSPADAVRRVQLQALAGGGTDRTEAWSSIAVLTREIPSGMKRRSR